MILEATYGVKDFKSNEASTHIIGLQMATKFGVSGDVLLLGENDTAGYFRCNGFTPDGVSIWGGNCLTIV